MTERFESINVDLNDKYAIDGGAIYKEVNDTIDRSYFLAIEEQVTSLLDEFTEKERLVTGTVFTFEGFEGDLEIANFDWKYWDRFLKVSIDVRINIRRKDHSYSVRARCDFCADIVPCGTYDDNGDDDGQDDMTLDPLINSPLIILLEHLSSQRI